MAKRSGIRGGPSLQRRLKALPEAVRGDVVSDLTAIGARLIARAKAEAPRRTGALAGALDYKVLPGALRLRIGLLTAGKRRQFFYGYILDAGRRGRTVTIKRGPRKGRQMRIAEISPSRYNFIFGRRSDFRLNELDGFRRNYVRSLQRALESGRNG